MDWIRFPDYEALCRKIGEEIGGAVAQKPGALLCLAAGNTSLGVFDQLVRMENEGALDLSASRFVAMDEWLGMNESTPGSCSDFLNRNFLSRLRRGPCAVRLVNGKAEDPEEECRQLACFIEENGGIDYLLLGCGMNGHLALNEPGTPFQSTVHTVRLDSTTRQVGQKYFQHPVELQGGVTIGFQEISRSRRVVLALNTAAKRPVLARLMESGVTEELPASFLKTLDQASVFYEAESDPRG